MKHLTVDILKDLAKQGKVPSVIVNNTEYNSSTNKNE